MDAVETYRKGNMLLELFYDETPTSPREWDNIGTIALFSNLYTFSESDALKGYEYTYFKKVVGYLKKYYNAVFVFPVCGSGDSDYYIGDISDNSRQILGAIYTTKARIIELCGEDPKYHTEEFIKNAFEGEMKELTQWANGDVYGYILSELVSCQCCKHVDKTHKNSVWGYFGLDYAREAILSENDFTGVEPLAN
jgi:hypothetical protein